MTQTPRLTFFCELHADELTRLFEQPQLISQLQAMPAQISLAIRDFTAERAMLVRRLNASGVPVIAWQLLPMEQGYWYNIHNAHQAVAGYDEFLTWTKQYDLQWAAIGVDIEPDITEFQDLLKRPLRVLPSLFRRISKRQHYDEASRIYHSLITRIQRDGYAVHSYEFLFMEDDRRAGSCTLSRLLGVTEVPADKRVLMLYSSFFRPYGVAVLCNYACQADAVAVGITGGGVEIEGMSHKAPLSWEELSQDLRLAARHCRDLHIFSLEGCVAQGFMEPLLRLDWTQPADQPHILTGVLMIARLLSHGLLWLTNHPFLSGGLIGFTVAWLAFRP